jgi:hypothetical protein
MACYLLLADKLLLRTPHRVCFSHSYHGSVLITVFASALHNRFAVLLHRSQSDPCEALAETDSAVYQTFAAVYLLVASISALQLGRAVKLRRFSPQIINSRTSGHANASGMEGCVAKYCSLWSWAPFFQHFLIMTAALCRVFSALYYSRDLLGMPAPLVGLLSALPYCVTFALFSLIIFQWSSVCHLQKLFGNVRFRNVPLCPQSCHFLSFLGLSSSAANRRSELPQSQTPVPAAQLHHDLAGSHSVPRYHLHQ